MSLIEVSGLNKYFPSIEKGKYFQAVKDVSFKLEEGEFLGLVGESGCGKSTIAKILVGLIPDDGGEIYINGQKRSYPYPRSVYREIQMIFQMPKDSFDPKKTVKQAMRRVQKNFQMEGDLDKRTVELLSRVSLDESYLKKYPHQMSGGECQRVAIARALAANPKIILCDEITSSLDVSVQAQIIDLLLTLKESGEISTIFISHDLALVQQVCDRVLVMKQGSIVEEGLPAQVLNHPEHPFTQELVSSIFSVD